MPSYQVTQMKMYIQSQSHTKQKHYTTMQLHMLYDAYDAGSIFELHSAANNDPKHQQINTSIPQNKQFLPSSRSFHVLPSMDRCTSQNALSSNAIIASKKTKNQKM